MDKFLKKRIFASQRGDAMIMLSLVLTGLVMLVSIIAVDKLKQSSKIQNTQLSSLEKTYKAEEGIEYSLFTAREGVPINTTSSSFNVSGWYNPDGLDTGQTIQSDPMSDIATRDPQEPLTIISQNKQDTSSTISQSKKLDKTIFANLPTNFPKQALLWYPRVDCVKDSTNEQLLCLDENIIPEGDVIEYVVLFPSNDWQRYSKFRFVFRCKDDPYKNPPECSIEGIRIGYYLADNSDINHDCLEMVNTRLETGSSGLIEILKPDKSTTNKYWYNFATDSTFFSNPTLSFQWTPSSKLPDGTAGIAVYFKRRTGYFKQSKEKIKTGQSPSYVNSTGSTSCTKTSYYWNPSQNPPALVLPTKNVRVGIVKVWGIR